MAKSFSFDIVSEIDMQEVDNAVNQSIKEVIQRYDLKDSNTEIELNKKDKQLSIESQDEMSLKACFDVIQSKFIKRNISLKSMVPEEIEQTSGGRVKQIIKLQSGISKDNAKKITKEIKESKIKVNAQIMDEIVRVTGQKKDDLQEVIDLVRNADYDFPVQFTNYK